MFAVVFCSVFGGTIMGMVIWNLLLLICINQPQPVKAVPVKVKRPIQVINIPAEVERLARHAKVQVQIDNFRADPAWQEATKTVRAK